MAGDQWKDAIRRNYSFFKNNIADPLDVVEYLYGETDPPILNENLKDQIKVEGTTSKKVGKMLDILMRRGPRVPQFLYQAFVETENPDCAEKLAPYLLLQEKEALKKDPSEWPPPKKEHRAMEKEPVTYLRPNDPCCCLQYNNTDEVYSLRKECRGVVFIINNMQFNGKMSIRHGTMSDRNNLKELFQALHFEVIVENDLTKQEIEDKTRLISQSDKVKDSDCFIFIILTHGGDEGVFGVDEKSVSVSTLTEMFEPNNCPGLNEKPKIFLIQACRGEKKEMVDPVGGSGNVDPVGGSGKSHADGDGRKEHVDTVDGPNVKSEPNISATKTVHSKSDFLIAYSTPEGSLSWRKTDAGSWFIQAIVWIFKYEAHLKDLVEMLGKVNNLVSKGHADHGGTHYVTISNYQSSLRKKLYFFPGIYGEKRVHPNIR
ncbi:caspase-6-like isoform X1 [Ostrea edulis]|uniref:caspase-6-like isoform X1 n=1 Tax=Ostrea edulis TaxID=37623 RepID=UPI0024AF918C|nr:caspase-6-like isoform X1 [Ostrea edulis]